MSRHHSSYSDCAVISLIQDLCRSCKVQCWYLWFEGTLTKKTNSISAERATFGVLRWRFLLGHDLLIAARKKQPAKGLHYDFSLLQASQLECVYWVRSLVIFCWRFLVAVVANDQGCSLDFLMLIYDASEFGSRMEVFRVFSKMKREKVSRFPWHSDWWSVATKVGNAIG